MRFVFASPYVNRFRMFRFFNKLFNLCCSSQLRSEMLPPETSPNFAGQRKRVRLDRLVRRKQRFTRLPSRQVQNCFLFILRQIILRIFSIKYGKTYCKCCIPYKVFLQFSSKYYLKTKDTKWPIFFVLDLINLARREGPTTPPLTRTLIRSQLKSESRIGSRKKTNGSTRIVLTTFTTLRWIIRGKTERKVTTTKTKERPCRF